MNKAKLGNQFSVSILMLIFSLSLHSCNAGMEEKLIGTWKGSDHLFVRTDGPDVVVTIDGGLERHLVSTLAFNEDKTYQKLVGEYDNGSGTWEVVDSELVLTQDSGNEVVYKLLKVADNELIISHKLTMDTPSGELSGEITLTYLR
jgi:hypothetical protein